VPFGSVSYYCAAATGGAGIFGCRRQLTMLNRFDLLIANDFSYVRCDQGETSVPFELIAERYERESMALAANQPFSGWRSHLCRTPNPKVKPTMHPFHRPRYLTPGTRGNGKSSSAPKRADQLCPRWMILPDNENHPPCSISGCQFSYCQQRWVF